MAAKGEGEMVVTEGETRWGGKLTGEREGGWIGWKKRGRLYGKERAPYNNGCGMANSDGAHLW